MAGPAPTSGALRNSEATRVYAPHEARKPRRSPDVSGIAFMARTRYFEWRLAVIAANGGNLRLITDASPFPDFEPA